MASVSQLTLTTTNHLHADLAQSPNSDSITRTANGPGLNASAIFNYQLNGDGYLEGTWVTNQLGSAAAIGLTTQSASNVSDLAEYLVTWTGTAGAFRIEKLGADQSTPSQVWQINSGDHAQVRITITGTTVTFEAFDVGVGWVELLELTGETVPANLRPIVFVSTDDADVKYVDDLLIDGSWSQWS